MKNPYQVFTEQLTYYMEIGKLFNFQELFHKYHGNCHGKEYLIKSDGNKNSPLYALFVKKAFVEKVSERREHE